MTGLNTVLHFHPGRGMNLSFQDALRHVYAVTDIQEHLLVTCLRHLSMLEEV